MEPQLPTPHFGPEATPQPVQPQGEVFQMPRGHTAEAQPAPVEQGKETREVFHDAPTGDPLAVQPVVTPPPMPVVDPTAQASAPAAQPSDGNPLAAADEDLIEKEWVEKAKKLVAETRNDPYAQDQAVGRLQADYLQKRYGKTIKMPNDG